MPLLAMEDTSAVAWAEDNRMSRVTARATTAFVGSLLNSDSCLLSPIFKGVRLNPLVYYLIFYNEVYHPD